MLLNAVSAAICTDKHFVATNNLLLEATYHPDVGDTKNWAEHHFLFLISVIRPALTGSRINYDFHCTKLDFRTK